MFNKNKTAFKTFYILGIILSLLIIFGTLISYKQSISKLNALDEQAKQLGIPLEKQAPKEMSLFYYIISELLILIVFIIFWIIYFIPYLISNYRTNKNETIIFLLNLFLGWTIIGWIILLVIAIINKELIKKDNNKQNIFVLIIMIIILIILRYIPLLRREGIGSTLSLNSWVNWCSNYSWSISWCTFILILNLIFWIIIIGLIGSLCYLTFKDYKTQIYSFFKSENISNDNVDSLELLKRNFASGNITEAEYKKRKKILEK